MKNILLASCAVRALNTRAFMSETVPTVRVKGADGQPMIINEADYDQKTHGKVIKEKPEVDGDGNEIAKDSHGNAIADNGDKVKSEGEKLRERISTLSAGVQSKGRKFFVVDALDNGKPVSDIPGIDPGGYKSSKDAWDAVFAVKSQNTDAEPAPGTPAGTHEPDEAAGTPKLDDNGQPVLDGDGKPVMVDAEGNDVQPAE